MKTITTLQALADFINSNEEWNLETERIIEANGWKSDCGTEYGICHNGNEYLELNERGEAVVIIRMKLENVKRLAAKHTAESAAIKDWRLTNNRDRNLKDLAKEWLKNGGYVIAKDSEIKKRYPEFCLFSVVDDAERVWAIYTNIATRKHGYKDLDIVAIANVADCE